MWRGGEPPGTVGSRQCHIVPFRQRSLPRCAFQAASGHVAGQRSGMGHLRRLHALRAATAAPLRLSGGWRRLCAFQAASGASDVLVRGCRALFAQQSAATGAAGPPPTPRSDDAAPAPGGGAGGPSSSTGRQKRGPDDQGGLPPTPAGAWGGVVETWGRRRSIGNTGSWGCAACVASILGAISARGADPN